MNGMHNFNFSLSLPLIWDTILEVVFFCLFKKREILALAVLLTRVPYFCCKSMTVTCTHTNLSFTEVIFFHISSYLFFSSFCLRFSFISELLFPVIMYLSSTALTRQEPRENWHMYITYISIAPVKQCLDFDTCLHWCVVINAFLIVDSSASTESLMTDFWLSHLTWNLLKSMGALKVFIQNPSKALNFPLKTVAVVSVSAFVTCSLSQKADSTPSNRFHLQILKFLSH